MDSASQALAQNLPLGVPKSYRSLADHSGAKAQSQQYLTPSEEKAVVDFMLQMSALGHPVRIKHVPFIAFSATRNRPTLERPLKPPGKNWAKALENRHPNLKARRVRALDWNRHENNISAKVTH
ncbi:hypothetical protein BAUCODRAFT_87975, partial [Baudoinia panamericana UAMH 10762]